MIDLYQATLSPDHGPLKDLHPNGFCRHEPTCSEYGKYVIQDRGVIIGATMTAKRLLSCHPWKKVSYNKIQAISKMEQNHPHESAHRCKIWHRKGY